MNDSNPDSPGFEKPKCRRCHRAFTPKKEGQEYGPKCARAILNNHIEIKNMKGKTVAVII